MNKAPLAAGTPAQARFPQPTEQREPPSLPPRSLCSITPFLLNVFQSIKTLGSIRTEQRGYDKVSFLDYPAPFPHSHTHQHHEQQQKESERGREHVFAELYKMGEKRLQPTKSPPPLFLSLYFSPANSLHFSPPLLIISIGCLRSSLYSAELICSIGL